MKFFLLPSLEHLAVVKFMVSLWNQNDIKNLMVKLNYYTQHDIWMSLNHIIFGDEKWKKIEETVVEKIHQLALPKVLMEKLLSVFMPIHLQILRWIKSHLSLSPQIPLSVEFCWTPEGILDRKRTAEILVKNENIDISKRYILACMYCLENDIAELWDRMPEDLRNFILDEIPDTYICNLVSYWTHAITQEGGHNATVSCQSIFQTSAVRGNKVATQYFLQKLTTSERGESLINIIASHADVLCPLLSEMEEEEQVKVFKNFPGLALGSFLDWPFQSFFTEMADGMRSFFSKQDYTSVLLKIVSKQENGFRDWNYKKTFREFWQKTPIAYKSFFIDVFGLSLVKLFRPKDLENITLIINDAAAIEKKDAVHCDSVHRLCQYLLQSCDWDSLKCFIEECLSSQDERLEFKDEFEKRALQNTSIKNSFLENKRKWDELFYLSSDSISEDDITNVKKKLKVLP